MNLQRLKIEKLEYELQRRNMVNEILKGYKNSKKNEKGFSLVSQKDKYETRGI